MASTPDSLRVDQLSPKQLVMLKNQIDEEVEFLSNSLDNLRGIQKKFTDSGELVTKPSSSLADQHILVPITSSMYLQGHLKNPDRVLVDVGTGYYIEMSRERAKDYFKRKVDFLNQQIPKIQPALMEKLQIRQVLMETINSKASSQLSSEMAALKT